MITVIFGAGASYGSGRCYPKNPPLGNYLFDDLVKLKRAFYRLPEGSKAVFKTEGFEAGMATIANDSRIINPLQKELACYLSSFSTTQENAYVRLFSKLRRYLTNINLVTLNYDLLIEQSLVKLDFSVDYNGNGKGINLLKPHGSSNFLPQLGDMKFSGNTFVDCETFFEGFPTNAVSDTEKVKAWCNDPRNSDVSPVLAIYAKDKRVVVNRQLIRETQNKYADFIAGSKLVVLVGIKYVPHDTHIWDPLAAAKSSLLVVDPYPDDTIAWANECGLDVSPIRNGFKQSVWAITKHIHSFCY